MAIIRDAFLLTIFIIGALYLAGAFHVIDSGHIGVYKRGGALLNGWTQPGLHFMIPFVTKYHQIQVTLQTDQVKNIPCGTSSGVVINFDNIQVVNRLRKGLAHETIKNYTVSYDQTWIFSKIHHEINQFCSSHTLQQVLIDKFNILDQSLKQSIQSGCSEWAPGIQIIAVRVTKPQVPKSIALTYEDRQVERTKLLITKQEQRLKQKKSEIQKMVSKIQAETQSMISQINNKMTFATKEANHNISSLQNEIVVLKQTAHARAKKYRQQKMIQLNKIRLIPQKQLENALKNLKSSSKTVYAQKIVQYLQNSEKLLEIKTSRQDKKK